MIQVEYIKPTDHHVRPYQELAAAVILRALLDFQPGPNRKEQTAAIQTEARDFLCGNGEFQRVRSIWCLWSGIRPESLSNFVTTSDDEPQQMPRPARRHNGRRAAFSMGV